MAMTAVVIIAVKLSNTARRLILLGSLSYFTRENLSEFISLIICAILQYIKNILGLELLLYGAELRWLRLYFLYKVVKIPPPSIIPKVMLK